LWVVVCGLGVAIVACYFGEVEVTGRERGVLRPAAGVRVLTSQMTGTVVSVEARSGDRVKSGAVLLRIESPAVEAQILEADRELKDVRTRFSATAVQEDHHYAEQVDSLHSRARRLTDQITSLESSVSLQKRHVEADQELLRKGLVSELSVADTREALAQAERQLSGAQSMLDQTRQELAALEARRQGELWQRRQVLTSAESKRDALTLVARQSVVLAPEEGTVEALLVKPGEVVQAGQPVGKIVPESGLRVIAFLAEKDRAFARIGDDVSLELDQLPDAEFGTLKARVTRIGDDLASPSEVSEALGDGQTLAVPAYRVELAITDAHAAEAAGVKLRTGTLLNARFTLRRQRLLTLVLSPLKRWIH
jgi:membrane fusion protein